MGLADNAARAAKAAKTSSMSSFMNRGSSTGAPKYVAKPAPKVVPKAAPKAAPKAPVKRDTEIWDIMANRVKKPPITGTGSVEKQILEQLKDNNITGNPGGSDGGGGNGGGNGGGDAALGLQETYANDAAQNAYNAAQAMRTFQRDQAGRQLTDALGTIDRAAIEGYKGIGNDYAARGLSRSGGYAQREDMAMADKTRADRQANQAVTDFLQMLDEQGTADLNKLGTTKQQILADFAARRFAGLGG
jgi:hypothetical protein